MAWGTPWARQGPPRIDLLPRQLVEQRVVRRQRTGIGAAFLVLLVLLGVWYLLETRQLHDAQAEADQERATAAGLRTQRAKLAASAGDDVDPEAGELVGQRLEAFVEEVRGSLDFYRSQQDATPLGRVVVSGGGSLLGPLVQRLQDATGVPVERGRTLAGIRVGRLGLDAEALAELEPTIAVPVGLAMRAVA